MPKAANDLLQKAANRLGEAALDPARWPVLIEEICLSVNSIGALLLQSDVRTTDVPVTESIKEPIDAYFRQGWHTRDYRARAAPLLMAGRPVVTDEDIISADEMQRHPFYNEAVFSAGLCWWAAIGFRAGASHWALSIHRTAKEGPFTAPEKRLLAMLAAPLAEASTLSTAVGRIALASATHTLNAVRQPAIAFDHFGLVMEANDAAEALFDDSLYIRNRRLALADPEARRSLECLARRIAASPELGGLHGLESFIIRRNGSAPIIAKPLAVPAAARSPFFGARAILTLTPLESKPHSDANLLIKAFGLTPAEARLAVLLSEGVSLESAAESLQVSVGTARSQLKAVFAKTDTHRQSQLVALLARF